MLSLVTTLTGPTWMSVITGVVGFGWILLRREWRRPLLLMGAMAVAVTASSLIKHELSRARPDPAFMVLGLEPSPSFPSGHTLGSAVFALTLAWLLVAHSRRRTTTPARTAVVAFGLAALFAAVVGYSRIYLGYHWLTDVLASAGLSLVVLAGVMAVDVWLSRR
ncbi:MULTISPECIES: phosphatase PAP2 family protein [Arthrobacter]|uniref:Phosphatase PAP2 family protein n=2 Tax=Arthrobacter TaxID=1663 RepID=A0ABU9KJ51_9MICC|nr:phosphatase PAP2 family protein [Arthrobacter sp. YJM1]MDP5226566.1 phosphatase PAP2 family protein [Arthrobacter sp. YJM1]